MSTYYLDKKFILLTKFCKIDKIQQNTIVLMHVLQRPGDFDKSTQKADMKEKRDITICHHDSYYKSRSCIRNDPLP